MINNGEIISICERGTCWMAKVAVKIDSIYEMVNVELKSGDVKNGRLVNGVRERVVNQALTRSS